MVEVVLEGAFEWIKTGTTMDDYQGKRSWSATLFPTPESLEKVRDLQAEGIKNVVKKDAIKGFFVKFSKKVEDKDKAGKVKRTYTSPVVKDANGNDLTNSLIGNGSTGSILVDLYTHPVKGGGTGKAARFEAIKIKNLIPYGQETVGVTNTSQPETAPAPSFF